MSTKGATSSANAIEASKSNASIAIWINGVAMLRTPILKKKFIIIFLQTKL
jgi:hypothetical protein